VLLLGAELLPVLGVLREIDLIGGPEGGKVLFVHFEDGVVVDGEEHVALGVFDEEGLRDLGGGEGRRGGHGNSNLYLLIRTRLATFNRLFYV
jgi:hypothetical protein